MAAALNDYFMHPGATRCGGRRLLLFCQTRRRVFLRGDRLHRPRRARRLHDADHRLALNQVLKETDLHNPAAALAEVNRTVKQSLGQFDGGRQGMDDGGEMHSDDGMDTAFCWGITVAAR